MKPIAALLILIVLSACGADGAPLRPTGTAGVSVGSGGVNPYLGVGATNGTFSVGLGL